MAVFWRFFTYYVYLLVGMIVVPNWVRKLINKNKKDALQKNWVSMKHKYCSTKGSVKNEN
jgi:hypothetical protein